PDGTQMLLAGTGGPAQIWSTKTFELESQFPAVDSTWGARFSGDGRAFLAVGGGDVGVAQIWSAPGALGRDFDATHENLVRCCAWDSAGGRVAIGSFQKRARVFDAQAGKLLLVLEHPDIVEDLKFSLDGTTLLTGCGDGNARLWSLSRSNLVIPLMKHDN